MVDFTKVINNEDMVQALNDLIHLNYDVKSGYDKALEKVSDADQDARLRQLKEMHERHIRQLGETVRVLGGSPAEGEDWRQLVIQGRTMFAGGDSGQLSAMHTNEQKLKDAYMDTLDRYKASGEIVEVINQVIDDGSDLRAWLEQEVGKT